jgi:hypothetical protein
VFSLKKGKQKAGQPKQNPSSPFHNPLKCIENVSYKIFLPYKLSQKSGLNIIQINKNMKIMGYQS